MSESEPEIKKLKMDEDKAFEMQMYDLMYSKKNLESVLSDEFYKPIPLVHMYVGHIKNPKDISKVLKILNEKIPLTNYQHLKRVLRHEILLCPTSHLDTFTDGSIQDFIHLHTSELAHTFDYFKTVEVLSQPPKTRKQYNESKKWSYNFHPNKYLELITSDSIFSAVELPVIRAYMGITYEIYFWYKKNMKINECFIQSDNLNATLIVDPVNNTIVTAAFDNRRNHPVQHSAMLAIDNVAKSQNGGAWNCQEEQDFNALDPDLMQYLKDKFTALSLYISRKKQACIAKENVSYLCTGYDVYLLREPCLMCAMALVHARAKRVFFCYQNTSRGALKSVTKLQCVPSLNHHFEVFTGFL